MLRQTISARSIARPLLVDLHQRPFSGRVWGVYRRACNLIDETGKVITLVLPEVGNGPFAIVINGSPDMFEALAPRQPVQATPEILTIGDWRISLYQATVWEPRLPRPAKALDLELMIDLVRPYAEWPHFVEVTPVAKSTAHLARQAAGQLSAALQHPHNEKLLEVAVTHLAGLGSGLTPAGDDYLLGTMAALWLVGQPDLLLRMASLAGPKTNALSRAFLEAAARGEFIEPWHALTLAWQKTDRPVIAQVIERIARFGASSGTDALAGFANSLEGLVKL